MARVTSSCPCPDSKTILKMATHPDAVILMATRPNQRYKSIEGREAAAVMIQKVYKGFKTRQRFHAIIPYIRAAKVLMKYLRIHKRKSAFIDGVKRMNIFHLKRAEALRKQFLTRWNIKAIKNVVIVPSVGVDSEMRKTIKDTTHLQSRQFVR